MFTRAPDKIRCFASRLGEGDKDEEDEEEEAEEEGKKTASQASEGDKFIAADTHDFFHRQVEPSGQYFAG